MSWDEIFRQSDYHHVIGPVYFAMLGLRKGISEELTEKFYQRYKKGLLLEEAYRAAEQTILWSMEQNRIPVLCLKGTESCRRYPKEEMGFTGSLEFLIDEKNREKVRQKMLEMDYEEGENRIGAGMFFTRVPGIKILFYTSVFMESNVLKKHFSIPAKGQIAVKTRPFVYRLTGEGRYLYFIGRLAELYMIRELRIRDILDFYLFRKSGDLEEQMEFSDKVLEKSGLSLFARQVEILSELWFGTKPEEADQKTYGLEDSILLQEEKELSFWSELLPYKKWDGLDFYRRNREEEWKRKRREWLFPSKEYMKQLFPVLDKLPFLLCFCWLIRIGHITRNMLRRKKQKQEEEAATEQNDTSDTRGEEV